MKYILLFSICAMVMAGCKKSSQACTSITSSYTYHFKQNARVDTLTLPGGLFMAVINAGNKIAFTYDADHSPCQSVIDGGSGEILMFDIDASLTYFKWYADDIANANCYYRRYCTPCMAMPAFKPTGGFIEGTKINNTTWKIQLDVKISSTYDIQFTQQFTAQ